MKMMILMTTIQPGRHSAVLLPVAHLLTALVRRMRWQRRRATMSQLQRKAPSGLGLGSWMTRRLRAGRHGVFCMAFYFRFYFPTFFLLGGRAADGEQCN